VNGERPTVEQLADDELAYRLVAREWSRLGRQLAQAKHGRATLWSLGVQNRVRTDAEMRAIVDVYWSGKGDC